MKSIKAHVLLVTILSTLTFKSVTSFSLSCRKIWSIQTPQIKVSSSLVTRFSEISTVSNEPSTTSSNNDKTSKTGAWIPVGSVSSLKDVLPTQIKIMNRNFAVWKEPKTQIWSVVEDVCPHRLAPLSQGRIDSETGCLQCPYHGWEFDTDGTLTKIPQLEADKRIPTKGNVKSYPVHVAGDLLFAFLPTEMHGESFEQSNLPEHFYPFLQEEIDAGKDYFVRDLPYSFDFLLENFMDPAHVPFAHHGLQSKREEGKPVPIQLEISNSSMVEMSFNDTSNFKERIGKMAFHVPSQYHFRTKNMTGDNYLPNLVIYCIPIKAGASRVIYSLPFVTKLPKWLTHAASNRFLNTDTWLHDAERTTIKKREETGIDFDYVLASSSDSGPMQFRSWWKKRFSSSPPHTFGAATLEQLGPVSIPRRVQIDNWENHSKHCSSCRSALAIMKKIQSYSLYVSLASVFLLKRMPLLGFALGTACIALHLFVKKCATVIEGNPYSSGISDRPVTMMN